MSRFTVLAIMLFALAELSPAQATRADPQWLMTVELLSPWDRSGGTTRYRNELHNRTCFSLVVFQQTCNRPGISYGNRFGDNWDILAVNGTQTRMIDLGKLEWSDRYVVPYIQPWAELRPGEERHIAVDTSGGDGADGLPGLNADGTINPLPPGKPKRESLGDKPIDRQVSTAVKTNSGIVRADNYMPFMEARIGHIYAIRVVEPKIDYYLVFRIDELEKGVRLKISMKKLDVPPAKPIY